MSTKATGLIPGLHPVYNQFHKVHFPNWSYRESNTRPPHLAPTENNKKTQTKRTTVLITTCIKYTIRNMQHPISKYYNDTTINIIIRVAFFIRNFETVKYKWNSNNIPKNSLDPSKAEKSDILNAGSSLRPCPHQKYT